jgi:hypothetical protein
LTHEIPVAALKYLEDGDSKRHEQKKMLARLRKRVKENVDTALEYRRTVGGTGRHTKA